MEIPKLTPDDYVTAAYDILKQTENSFIQTAKRTFDILEHDSYYPKVICEAALHEYLIELAKFEVAKKTLENAKKALEDEKKALEDEKKRKISEDKLKQKEEEKEYPKVVEAFPLPKN